MKCLFCFDQFTLKKSDSKFCENCRNKYGIHIARTYNLLSRERICIYCKQKFSGVKGKRICGPCNSIPHIAQRVWRERNPQRAKEVMKKYRGSHLEICRERGRKSQRVINNRVHFGGLRYKVLDRDSWKCKECHKDISAPYMASVHHINHNH